MDTEGSDKRQAIIEATMALVGEYGFHGTPISMIAKKAGVGAGSIYRHFKDKDHLIGQVHAQLLETFNGFIVQGYDESRPLRERYLFLLRRMLDFATSYEQEFRFLEYFYNSPFGYALRRQLRQCEGSDCGKDDPLARLFREGQAMQVIKPLPEPVLCSMAFGPIILLGKDVLEGMLEWDEVTIQGFLEACWDAVKL